MKFFTLVLAAGLVAAGAGAAVAAMAGGSVALAPSQMHWTAGTGPSKGTMGVILAGDPNKAAVAVIRVKMPDGYVNQPHYHSQAEYITVMSGTLLFGLGDTVNKSQAKVLPAGSFVMVPANVHHWSVAQGTTVEQVGGIGPLTNLPIKHTGM